MTFAGQPVGLTTLAVAVAEEPDTVEEVYEPFLLKEGLLQRTPRGRVATPGAYAHLGLRRRRCRAVRRRTCSTAALAGAARSWPRTWRSDPRVRGH